MKVKSTTPGRAAPTRGQPPRAFAGLLACGLSTAACYGVIGRPGQSSDAAFVGGEGGGATSTGGGSTVLLDGCSPPCTAPQRCSAVGQCIDAGTCLVQADCEPGLQCDAASQTCLPGGNCGAEELPITAPPPNVLIALNRTGSMGKSVPNTGKSRWQMASEAVVSQHRPQ